MKVKQVKESIKFVYLNKEIFIVQLLKFFEKGRSKCQSVCESFRFVVESDEARL